MHLLPPTPNDESSRLQRLRNLLVLDTEPEPVFDRLARFAAEACGVAQGLLSLVDERRQWFKASAGPMDCRETPRTDAFCAHAIVDDGLFEVPDAAEDPRFRDNPLVVGEPRIRFYAGVPLRWGPGSAVGTLCVVDFRPGRLSGEQRKSLEMLAMLAVDALQMRQRLVERTLQAAQQHSQEIAATQAQYEALVERQDELVSLARPNGQLVFVNSAYARHHGCRVDDLIGTSLYDKIPPAERPSVRSRIDGVLNTGQRIQAENRVIGADGQEHWIQWTNSVQPDEQGRPLLHSVGRDVTDRVLAEAALRERESFLDRTGRVAGIGGWQLDIRSGELTWSAQTRRIHEVPDDYRPSLETAISFYAPEARAQVEAAVSEGLREGTPWDLELSFVTAKGRPIWVRAVGEVEFEAGEPRRLVGAFQDITERRELQNRVEESERFLQKITDALPVRISYLDSDLRYRFVNDAHCRRFGRPREDLLGRARSDLVRNANPVVDEKLRAALGGVVQRFEFDDLVEGERRRIESQLIPDVNTEGRVVGLYTTGIDITERSAAEQSLRDLTAILESTDDLVVQTDRDGNIRYLNTAARQAMSIAEDGSLVGLNFAQFNTEETNRLFAETILPAVRQRGCWVGDTTVLGAGGRILPVSHLVIAHRDKSGRVARFSAVMRDESAKVDARREALRQTATLRSVAESIPACVAVVGADQRYRFVNSAFERWIGAAREAVVGRTVEEVLGAADYARVRPAIEQVLRGESVSFEREYAKAGSRQYFAVSYVPMHGEGTTIEGFVGVLQDISEHRDNEQRLTNLSERDPLTGLHNRAGVEHRLVNAIANGEGPGLALLYLDLDHFKPVNDTLGHQAGDDLLRQFADRLRHLVRPSDLVARIGGDEFLVVLQDLRTAAHAEAVAAKLVEAARRPFDVNGQVVQIGASVGVAFGVAVGDSATNLMARADAALYAAKRSGRGTQKLAA